MFQPSSNSPAPTHSGTPQARASTGVAGLDDIMGGGFPMHHVYLIEGEPGTGKTTLGLQFLLDGVVKGERALYVTLSETSEELHTIAASHGWLLDGIDVFELVPADSYSADSAQSILHPSEIELGETVRNVTARVEQTRPSRVVFDSLSEMRLLAQEPLRYRRQILALKHFFARSHCTVLMLDDRTAPTGDMQLHSICHGVVLLENSRGVYGSEKRRLRVEKMRGIKFRGGEHDYDLDTGGLRVFPRLVASEHGRDFSGQVVDSGNAHHNQILGGGLTPGTNVLLAGPSGIGKTTTALACVSAALERGERAAYYLFDESLGTILQRSRSLNIPIEKHLKSGLLSLRVLDPAEVTPGEFAHLVRTAVDEGAQTIVIDSLNAYLQAMPGGKFLVLQMHELLTYLNRQGVVTLMIIGHHGLAGEAKVDIDLSYLSDAILQFRFFEARGQLLKAIAVVKSRAQPHEVNIREFRVGPVGIQIGEVLRDFDGVLGNVPHYHGVVPLMGDADPSIERP
jgi:circadian clock protein KaiC